MTSISDQFSAVRKAQFEAQFNFFNSVTSQALESASRVAALNLAVSRDVVQRSLGTSFALMNSRDPRDVLSLGGQAEEQFRSLFAYGRELLGIASGVRPYALRPQALSLTPQQAIETVEVIEHAVADSAAAAASSAAAATTVPEASAAPAAAVAPEAAPAAAEAAPAAAEAAPAAAEAAPAAAEAAPVAAEAAPAAESAHAVSAFAPVTEPVVVAEAAPAPEPEALAPVAEPVPVAEPKAIVKAVGKGAARAAAAAHPAAAPVEAAGDSVEVPKVESPALSSRRKK